MRKYPAISEKEYEHARARVPWLPWVPYSPEDSGYPRGAPSPATQRNSCAVLQVTVMADKLYEIHLRCFPVTKDLPRGNPCSSENSCSNISLGCPSLLPPQDWQRVCIAVKGCKGNSWKYPESYSFSPLLRGLQGSLERREKDTVCGESTKMSPTHTD